MNVDLDPVRQSGVQSVARKACRLAHHVPARIDRLYRYVLQTEDIVRFFFWRIEKDVDAMAAQEIKAWADYDFDWAPEDRAAEWAWMMTLIDIRNEYPDPIVPLGLKIERYRDLVGRIEDQIIAWIVEERRLISIVLHTDWDKEVYRRYLVATGRPPSEFPDFRSAIEPSDFHITRCVEGTIEGDFFRRFWANVLADFSEDEIACLFDWYQKANARKLETLPYLRTMPRAPRRRGVR